MLKKIWRLFLGLVVCMGSACVTPTHASSANSGIILTHVQAGVTGDPTNEMVAIYNNSDTEINITGWCIVNENDVALICFTDEQPAMKSIYILPPYASAVVATQSFIDTHELDSEQLSLVYVPANTRSGSLTGSGDVVGLFDVRGELQDVYTWDKSATLGKIAQRQKSETNGLIYETAGENAGWFMRELLEIPTNQLEVYQEENPEGIPGGDQPPLLVHPIITELLPDPNGADTGQEFIELYNPSDTQISLDDYVLRMGRSLEKSHRFPKGAVIEPGSYAVYTNNEVKYSLLNSASNVQLEYKGQPVGDVVMYETPPTGQSWAYINDTWQYTTLPTPGQENAIGPPAADGTENMVTGNMLKPCAPNQYRNPTTNRCRLINTSSSKLQPCKPGQVRNPDTNRCRSVSSATKTPAPCKEGQERNPETNRCRMVVKMTAADHAVKGVTTQQSPTHWYVWLGIVGVVGCIVAYAAWEWRVELKTAFQWLRRKLIH